MGDYLAGGLWFQEKQLGAAKFIMYMNRISPQSIVISEHIVFKQEERY